MKDVFEVGKIGRKLMMPYFTDYSLAQLNEIPAGFSNNLIWNLGHILVTQQILVYKLSNLPMCVSDELFDKYRKGSCPKQDVSQEEVDTIKELFISSMDQMEKDYTNGIFKTFNEYLTSSSLALNSVERAMDYNNFHEGTHLGVMMAIKKQLSR